MTSSPSTASAARPLPSSPQPHAKKRTSRPTPSAQTLSDRLKQHHLRERQRTLQNLRVGAEQDCSAGSSSQAVVDPWASTESVPAYTGLTLPRQLSRAPYRAPRPEALAAVDIGLVDTNIEYIKDCMELRGEHMYTSLRNTSILTLHKPHGPHCFPTSARVRITHAHSDLPTHLLAVRSSLPDGHDLADDLSLSSSLSLSTSPTPTPTPQRPAAHYTPIHALTLAVYAPLVVPLPSSDPSLQLPPDFDAGNTIDLTLPVIVMRVPSPRTLGMLLAILYSQRYDNLVKALLGIPLSPTSPLSQSTLLTQSIFTSLFPLTSSPPSPPSPNTSQSHTALTTRLTHLSHLLALAYLTPLTSKDLSLPLSHSLESPNAISITHAASALTHRTRLTQALAANARALGVCDLAFWGALDVAWAVLLGALGLVAGSASASASASASGSASASVGTSNLDLHMEEMRAEESV